MLSVTRGKHIYLDYEWWISTLVIALLHLTSPPQYPACAWHISAQHVSSVSCCTRTISATGNPQIYLDKSQTDTEGQGQQTEYNRLFNRIFSNSPGWKIVSLWLFMLQLVEANQTGNRVATSLLEYKLYYSTCLKQQQQQQQHVQAQGTAICLTVLRWQSRCVCVCLGMYSMHCASRHA